MEYKKNMLLMKKTNEGCIYRVLAIKDDRVMVIDCGKMNMPVWKKTNELGDFVEKEENELKDQEIESLDAQSRKIAYQRFTMVSRILPFLTDESMRSVAIGEVADEYGKSRQTVRSYLCSYLATQEISSLAPRKRENDRPLNYDEKNIRKSLNKWYYTTKKRSLKSVYILMLQNYYCDGCGNLVENYPTFYQFRYFFRKYNRKETEYISRNGLTYYQRNQRPLTGDGVQGFAGGVGTVLLDGTVLDIYLVNDSGEIVGRPVFVAGVDAYSGLCCGYSLLWEGGIYSLRNLMMNIVADKVSHCRRFGIDINGNQWPCSKMPLRIVTDMGSEYRGDTFSQLTDLGIEIVNLPPYRPELKGPVEKFFDCIQGYYRNHLKGKGVVEPDFRERGAHDYRKDACLDLRQLETILLHCIIYYNSGRVLENFPFTEDMLNRGVKPYANEVWNYGCGMDGCTLMDVKPEELLLVMLQRKKGRFTRHGLSVNGLHYHNGAYSEAYLQGMECVVAFDSEDASAVWLVENGTYTKFELVEKRFMNKGIMDVEAMRSLQRRNVKNEVHAMTQAQVDLARHIRTVAQQTDGQKVKVKNIRENRKKEIYKNHGNTVKGDDDNE